MRRFVLIVLLPLLTGCDQWKKFATGTQSSSSSGAPISAVVFGQSNAVSPANGQILRYSITGMVSVNDYYCDGGDAYSNPPKCFEGMAMVTPSERFPIRSNQTWLILGDMLYGLTGRATIFYNTARGGSSTQQLLDRGEFENTLSVLRAHPEIKFLIWNQGEAETDPTGNESYSNLKYMIERTKGIRPDLIWVIALNSNGRMAQERLISEGLALQGPDIDLVRRRQSIELNNPSIEFEGQGHEFHAQAWFEVLKSLQPWQ